MADAEMTVAVDAPTRPRLAVHPETEAVRVIEPGRTAFRIVWSDVWRSRELLYFLTWRDIKVRYKQTALGVLWAILQPVLTMVVMSVIFGTVAGLGRKTGGTPYPIFLYSALLPWTFFAGAITGCSNCVVANATLVTKVQFPRISLPISNIAAGLVDFGLSFLVLLAMMAWYRTPIRPAILAVPVLILGVSVISLGFGAIFAALTVSYRDFRYLLPFVAQIWMYLTPVIYPANMLPHKWRWLIELNPLTGWIGTFRTAILGAPIDRWGMLSSVLTTGLVVIAGTYYFGAVERRFADVI